MSKRIKRETAKHNLEIAREVIISVLAAILGWAMLLNVYVSIIVVTIAIGAFIKSVMSDVQTLKEAESQ